MTFFFNNIFLKQFINDDMLFIFNVTNIEIKQTNLRNSTNQKRIKKIKISIIELCDQNLDINFQNEMHVIQIILKFFKIFQNFIIFTFNRIIFRFNYISHIVFVFIKISFFIFDLNKHFFQFLKLTSTTKMIFFSKL